MNLRDYKLLSLLLPLVLYILFTKQKQHARSLQQVFHFAVLQQCPPWPAHQQWGTSIELMEDNSRAEARLGHVDGFRIQCYVTKSCCCCFRTGWADIFHWNYMMLFQFHICVHEYTATQPDCNCSHKYSFLSRDQVLLKLVSGQDQASSVTILNSGSLLHKPTQILQPRARNSPSFSITSACSIW